jgi:hypothetical protein
MARDLSPEMDVLPPQSALPVLRLEVPRLALMSTIVPTSRSRVTVDGKFFRVDGRKFHPKGVTYGPFESGIEGEGFASRERTLSDLERIRELGANTVRVYHLPPRWFLDLLQENGLKVLVDVPWNKHLCFLDSEESRQDARDRVRRAARLLRAHPAVLALVLALLVAVGPRLAGGLARAGAPPAAPRPELPAAGGDLVRFRG